jgi:hypothetical protein
MENFNFLTIGELLDLQKLLFFQYFKNKRLEFSTKNSFNFFDLLQLIIRLIFNIIFNIVLISSILLFFYFILLMVNRHSKEFFENIVISNFLFNKSNIHTIINNFNNMNNKINFKYIISNNIYMIKEHNFTPSIFFYPFYIYYDNKIITNLQKNIRNIFQEIATFFKKSYQQQFFYFLNLIDPNSWNSTNIGNLKFSIFNCYTTNNNFKKKNLLKFNFFFFIDNLLFFNFFNQFFFDYNTLFYTISFFQYLQWINKNILVFFLPFIIILILITYYLIKYAKLESKILYKLHKNYNFRIFEIMKVINSTNPIILVKQKYFIFKGSQRHLTIFPSILIFIQKLIINIFYIAQKILLILFLFLFLLLFFFTIKFIVLLLINDFFFNVLIISKNIFFDYFKLEYNKNLFFASIHFFLQKNLNWFSLNQYLFFNNQFFFNFSNICICLITIMIMFILFNSSYNYIKEKLVLNFEIPLLFLYSFIFLLFLLFTYNLLILFILLEIFSYTLYILISLNKEIIYFKRR